VKLALLLGAVLGASVIPALAIAFLAGALLGAALLVRVGRSARKSAVPFGPFLAAGALMALWCGPAMLNWYAHRIAGWGPTPSPTRTSNGHRGCTGHRTGLPGGRGGQGVARAGEGGGRAAPRGRGRRRRGHRPRGARNAHPPLLARVQVQRALGAPRR